MRGHIRVELAKKHGWSCLQAQQGNTDAMTSVTSHLGAHPHGATPKVFRAVLSYFSLPSSLQAHSHAQPTNLFSLTTRTHSVKMLAHYTRCAHVSSASARPSRPQSVICLARSSNTTTTNNNSVVERSTAAGLAAALSACVVLSTPLSASAAASAPEPERRSFGAERTAKLIEESGTPGAVRPGRACGVLSGLLLDEKEVHCHAASSRHEATHCLDHQCTTPPNTPLETTDNMKTNIPFQAPGINAPPRGPGQQKGTSPKKVFGNIKKTIKEQYRECVCVWWGRAMQG